MNRTPSQMNFHATFNKIDADGSGCISKEELRSYLSGNSEVFIGKKDFDKLFGAIDTDRSGSIDFNEYSRFMEQATGGKKRRSSMKVSTQEESLASSSKKKQQEAMPLTKSMLLSMKESRRRGSMNSSMNSLSGSRRGSLASLLSLGDSQHDFSLGDSLHDSTERSTSTIRFFDVEVREYSITASDNPCVSAGAAIELSWDYNTLERVHLDTFEEKRSTERVKDMRKEKKLTKSEREKILREFGATQKDIQEAAKRATIIRNARRKSIGTKHLDKKHERKEGQIESLKKLFRRKSIEDKKEAIDHERLHPTLIDAMMGLDTE